MKKLCFLLIILFFGCYSISHEETICYEKPIPPKKAASFMVAYQYVLQKEGFYSFHRSDFGMETYCGISRRYFPESKIWQYVDDYKKHHIIKWNDSIPGDMIKWYILDHYLSIWVSENFYLIEDQDIATYTFDFRVNSSYLGIKTIQETLNDIGYPTKVTGFMGEETIENINSCPKWEFMARLISNRVEYYTSLAQRHPSQRVFLDNWISRTRLQ